MIRYLSLCSGIEAATVAWHGLGLEPVAFSEIEPFPCKVLQHHYPNVPNLGDMTQIDGSRYRGAVQLVVGGTPCQDFSIAGTRKGLAGERSGLALHFVRLAQEIRPEWLLWENVPGCFSTNGGMDFLKFVCSLDECGFSLSWRVLDAQFFGVPQRRRRVFLVGHLGDWASSYKVLFERDSLCRDTAQGGTPRKENTPQAQGRTGSAGDQSTYTMQGFGDYKQCGVASPAKRRDYKDATDLVVTGTLSAMSFQGGGISSRPDTAAAGLLVPDRHHAVRRLTPLECERLQGFPDNYTDIPGASDTARYKALGNSMAVPCMRWIGERIVRVENGDEY